MRPPCPLRARKQGQQRSSAVTHGLTEAHAAWAAAGHVSRATTLASWGSRARTAAFGVAVATGIL